MTEMKATTARHKLTTAGIYSAGIGVLLAILGIVGIANGSSWTILGLMAAFLLVPVGVILMIAGWMIRVRQAAELR